MECLKCKTEMAYITFSKNFVCMECGLMIKGDPMTNLKTDFQGDYHPKGIIEQNQAIRDVCNEMAEFLCGKNNSYGGSAFTDVSLGGKTIKAADAIKVRMADKIKRLTSGQEYGSDDTMKDLLGYLIIMLAEKNLHGI